MCVRSISRDANILENLKLRRRKTFINTPTKTRNCPKNTFSFSIFIKFVKDLGPRRKPVPGIIIKKVDFLITRKVDLLLLLWLPIYCKIQRLGYFDATFVFFIQQNDVYYATGVSCFFFNVFFNEFIFIQRKWL